MKTSNLRRPALLALAVLATVPAACGSDDGDSDAAAEAGAAAEAAFLRAMIPHHRSAIEMAQMASEKGEHPQIRQLAESITRAQSREITQMRNIYRRLFGSAIQPDADAHMELSLSAEDAGMGHEDMSALERAKPFDRVFIDEMVGHHQGAIRMARAVSAKSDDSGVEQLADSIIQAQAAEIGDMNAWRERWYGAKSPAGGVPADSDSAGLPPEGGDTTEDHGTDH